MCVSRLGASLGAGVWGANHKTIGAWAERANPERYLIINNNNTKAESGSRVGL